MIAKAAGADLIRVKGEGQEEYVARFSFNSYATKKD